MSSVVISGDTSGAVTLAAPAVAGTNTLTLLAATATSSVNVLGTALAYNWNGLTTNTSLDFTGLPAWVKRITVMFAGVSTTGTSHILVQLGAGSVTSTGYISTAQFNAAATVGNVSSTAGFIVWNDVATFTFSGSMKIQTLGSNIWVSDHTFKVATNQTGFGGGDITLGGTLDRLRITTVSGTPTFDAGSVNIMYEG